MSWGDNNESRDYLLYAYSSRSLHTLMYVGIYVFMYTFAHKINKQTNHFNLNATTTTATDCVGEQGLLCGVAEITHNVNCDEVIVRSLVRRILTKAKN